MILDVVHVGDPVLRGRAREVSADELATPFVQELIASMRHTLTQVPGVGLAAPQVRESLRIFVVVDRAQFLEPMSDARRDQLERRELNEQVLVNPVPEPVGNRKVEFVESCLSVPGLSAVVARWHSVRVRALDEHRAPVELEWAGWPARILQHELGHLDGTLYVDRMDPRTLTTTENLKRWWKARSADEIRHAMAAGSRSGLGGRGAAGVVPSAASLGAAEGASAFFLDGEVSERSVTRQAGGLLEGDGVAERLELADTPGSTV